MRHRGQVSRDTAEQLLDGVPTGPQPDALLDMLAAAAAPAQNSELTGEAAALTAFRGEAFLASVPAERRSVIRTVSAPLARLLSPKLAAGLVLTLTAGGVALAAATSSLPTPHEELAPAYPAISPTEDTPSSRPGTGAAALPASPVGLCRAYAAHSSKPGKAHDTPGFIRLVTAAGGKDKVAGYCAAVIATQNGRPGQNSHTKPPKKPKGHGKPKKNPPGKPHPKPTSHPVIPPWVLPPLGS